MRTTATRWWPSACAGSRGTGSTGAAWRPCCDTGALRCRPAISCARTWTKRRSANGSQRSWPTTICRQRSNGAGACSGLSRRVRQAVTGCKIVAASSHTAEWVLHGLHPLRADGPQGLAALPRHDVDGQVRLAGLGARRGRFDSHPEARPRSRHQLLRHGGLVFNRSQRGGRRPEPAADERTRATGARDQGVLSDERRPERSWPVAQAHSECNRPVAGADRYGLCRPLRDPCLRCGNARTAHDVYQEYYGDEIDGEIARRVREVAARRGVSAAHVAMAWVAGSPNPNVPVVGAAKTAHLEVAVEALALRLDAAERAFLEAPYRPRDEINDQNPVRRPRALHPG